MALDILITFGSISFVLATFGLVLLAFAEVVGKVEERRDKRAWAEWVEKYGISGRK